MSQSKNTGGQNVTVEVKPARGGGSSVPCLGTWSHGVTPGIIRSFGLGARDSHPFSVRTSRAGWQYLWGPPRQGPEFFDEET